MTNKPFSDILPQDSDFAIECMHFQQNVTMSTPHFHTHYEICYVQSGKRMMIINNTSTHELSSSTIALLRPNIIHQGFSAENTTQTRILINISQKLMSELTDFFSPTLLQSFNTPILKLSSYESSMLNYFFKELLDLSANDPLYNERIKINLSKILLLLYDAYCENKSNNDTILTQIAHFRIDYAVEYIQRNYSLPNVLSEIATELHLSEIYLERIFKKSMNISMYKYLSNIRIINAKRLLESKSMSVSEIAISCGFSSVSAFSRAFKNISGMSPKQYQSTYDNPHHGN